MHFMFENVQESIVRHYRPDPHYSNCLFGWSLMKYLSSAKTLDFTFYNVTDVLNLDIPASLWLANSFSELA